jgi:hypothetical protein
LKSEATTLDTPRSAANTQCNTSVSDLPKESYQSKEDFLLFFLFLGGVEEFHQASGIG